MWLCLVIVIYGGYYDYKVLEILGEYCELVLFFGELDYICE